MFSSLRRFSIFFVFFIVFAFASRRGEASVAILANNTDTHVNFSIVDADGKQQPYLLDRTDVIPIPADKKIGIVFKGEGNLRRYLLQPNSINYFVEKDKSLDLLSFQFPVPPNESPNYPPPKPRAVAYSSYVITVKILADDDEPAIQRIWEREFRERIAAASEIFEHHCGVRFEVKAVETWISDNRITDFQSSLGEFETKVNPAPAQVAIGFTSQYAIPRGLTHLGGTRGTLHSHILIREWSQYVTRSERLEILVHELGHFLGASHSADPDSVMRPKLGDRRSHATSFRIGFDPLNTLALNLIGDELRAGEYHGFAAMPLDTRRQLQRIYLALGKDLPDDPAAARFIDMLNLPRLVSAPPTPKPPELVAATQEVVHAVVEAARVNRSSFTELKGDAMTEYFIRRAAAEAAKLPPPLAAKAFLLGIGIALDDSRLWRDFPILNEFCQKVESENDRQVRIAILGKTTMRGRHDLAQHFVVSCALTIPLGPLATEQAGVAKEISDAQGESGFSFVDLSADVAGVTFATQVRAGKIPLAELADSFKICDFLPEFETLEEGISWQEFTTKYGSLDDDRCKNVRGEIQKRIHSLPGYKNIDSP